MSDQQARELVRRLLDAGEPEAHKNAPQTDAEWGSRTGGILDCPWCAAREFLATPKQREYLNQQSKEDR